MSGDSPNAFNNDNIFEYTTQQKDDGGRSSPKPTTSKDTTGIQDPIIEPAQKDDGYDVVDDDKTDFSSPLHDDLDTHRTDVEKTLPLCDQKYDEKHGDDNKDLINNKIFINGELKKDLYDVAEHNDDKYDDCIVNCLYYTGECCKCTII